MLVDEKLSILIIKLTPKGVYPTTAKQQLSTISSFSSFSVLTNVLESVKRVYYKFFDEKISILITKFDPKGGVSYYCKAPIINFIVILRLLRLSKRYRKCLERKLRDFQ